MLMTTFSELPLVFRSAAELGSISIPNPTPIPMRALPPALDGRHVIGTAQTSTGKTLAFLISILEMLQHESSRRNRALVLLPTRELTMQVYEQYDELRSKNIAKAAARE